MKCIGIDLGTGFSCVSVMEKGKPKVIIDSTGNRIMPSIVSFTDDGVLVGNTAKRQAAVNPSRTIYGAKRLIGRKFNDPVVQDFSKHTPFKIVEGAKGEALIEVDGKTKSPVEISALVLLELKKTAEAYLGSTVSEAVITVPAFFDDSQRQATKDAAIIAGLDVKRIINEPTSAALSMGIADNVSQKIIVLDTGSGTHDVSILDIGDGVMEVIATNGDLNLGGLDFDQRIISWASEEFKKSEGIDLLADPMAVQRLRDESEKAKKELSTSVSVDINIPFITADASGPKHLSMKLSRAKFEELTLDLVDRILDPCKVVLKDSGLTVEELDSIIMVGGSSRIPAIQAKVESFFGKSLNKSANPDEAISEGAAIQGGVFYGEGSDVLLLDVTPLSLSIETLGGIATKIVEKNTTIPVTKTQIFSTAADNQPAVSIHVTQGERQMATDNKTLGRFDLVDIPPSPRGVPQIEVKFDIDANGITTVSAKDLGTGKEQSIRIQSSSGLSKEEIERMIVEAESYKEQDEKKKELVEARNNADATIFNVTKSLKDAKADVITTEDKEPVEKLITELQDVMKQEDASVIKAKAEELLNAFHSIATKMYANTNTPPTEEPTTTTPQEDNVVDAEFTTSN